MRCIPVGVLLSVMPAIGSAQDSHWDVSVSFTPTWKAHDSFRDSLLFEGEGPIEGTEFTIGVVRGSSLDGEWGVSYVQKPFKDGVGQFDSEQQCFQANFCSTATTSRTMQDVMLKGVEFHWFRPFVTIEERVQIGIILAGGVAKPEGTIIETFENVTTFPLPQGVQTQTNSDTFATPAKDVLQPTQPLGKVEIAGAIIVAPALKIRVSGGFNYPSVAAFRVGGVVLFGGN